MSDKHKNDTLDIDAKLTSEIYKAEDFIQKNRNVLIGVVVALVLLVGGYIGFKQFFLKPQEEEAQVLLFKMQDYFEMDSFSTVVHGNGTDPSAVEIADDYGMTKAGNLAAYYAGISYLRLGEYQNAVDYLKKFNADDQIITPLAMGAIGDAYVELERIEDGASQYMKAARESENKFTTPYFLKKAGLAYEKAGKPGKAVDCYEEIKKEYENAQETQEIDKYLYRAKASAGELEF